MKTSTNHLFPVPECPSRNDWYHQGERKQNLAGWCENAVPELDKSNPETDRWQTVLACWAKVTSQGWKPQQNCLKPSCEVVLLREEEEFRGERFPIHLGKCIMVDHTGSGKRFTTCCLFRRLCRVSTVVYRMWYYTTLLFTLVIRLSLSWSRLSGIWSLFPGITGRQTGIHPGSESSLSHNTTGIHLQKWTHIYFIIITATENTFTHFNLDYILNRYILYLLYYLDKVHDTCIETNVWILKTYENIQCMYIDYMSTNQEVKHFSFFLFFRWSFYNSRFDNVFNDIFWAVMF